MRLLNDELSGSRWHVFNKETKSLQLPISDAYRKLNLFVMTNYYNSTSTLVYNSIGLQVCTCMYHITLNIEYGDLKSGAPMMCPSTTRTKFEVQPS